MRALRSPKGDHRTSSTARQHAHDDPTGASADSRGTYDAGPRPDAPAQDRSHIVRPSASAEAIERGAQLPELGVGLIYNSAIESLLEAHPGLVDVLEIEPQTTWVETRDEREPYVARLDVDEHIAALPGRKLVHSVGTPVGGSVRGNRAQIPLLKQAIERLGAPWASEHLSFNLTPDFFTGFFLPPRQTEAGLATYVESIAELRAGLGVPLAVETGVNYLRPRPDEMPDGEFVGTLADAAGCGILLDLHNIYCNALNGRQPVEQFLSQIPLDRVWELHVAGGFELDGFWLDAHSGAIPEPLERICQEIVPALPNLKAIVFEVFSSFLPRFGLDGTQRQLERLRGLWETRRTAGRRAASVETLRQVDEAVRLRAGISSSASVAPLAERQHDAAIVGGSHDAHDSRAAHGSGSSRSPDAPTVTPSDWERALGAVVIGRAPASALEEALADDPGAMLIRALIKEFRASMVVGVYRMTSRLLMLALGPDVFRAFLEDFWSKTAPSQYAGTEADAFADYLQAKGLRIPQLQAILAFERATLATLRDGQTRVARFNVDPLPMLRALADGVLLENPGAPGDYEIEVTAEGPVRVAGVDVDAVNQTFPFH